MSDDEYPNDRETPYHIAEGYQNDKLKALVLGGKCNANSLVTMLARKCDWHDYEGVKWLLEHGADPNRISDWGRNALHQALERNNRLPLFALLLDHGADPLVRNKLSRSSVEIAARYGRADVLDLFGERGVDIRLGGWDEILAKLAHGVDIEVDPRDVYDIESREPAVFGEFAGSGNLAGTALLLKYGFDPDRRTSTCGAKDDTPLHAAIWRGRHAIVKLLVGGGAPLEATNGHGQTPLVYAVNAALRSEWYPNRSTTEDVVALIAAGADKSIVTLPTGWSELDALFG